MILDLPFKRLSGTAIGPTRAYERDAAYDLYSDHEASVGTLSTVINTNVAVAIPEGHGGLLMGRSSVGKESVHPLGFLIDEAGILRLAGVIDSGYRGSLRVMLASVSPGAPWRPIKQGEAIAQLWILPIPATEPYDVGDGELPPAVRGERWNGSSNGREAASPRIPGKRSVRYFDMSLRADRHYHPGSGRWYLIDDYPFRGVGTSDDPPDPPLSGTAVPAQAHTTGFLVESMARDSRSPIVDKPHGPGSAARESFLRAAAGESKRSLIAGVLTRSPSGVVTGPPRLSDATPIEDVDVEASQAERKARAEENYGVPCVFNEGTGHWEPGFPPVDADPFAGMERAFQHRAEWERRGRPPLPRYGSPHSEIIAALWEAPECDPEDPEATDPAERTSDPVEGSGGLSGPKYGPGGKWHAFLNDRDKPDPALSGLIENFDRAIRTTSIEVAEAILIFPRPPAMSTDDYRAAVAALVDDRFRKNFKLGGLPGGKGGP